MRDGFLLADLLQWGDRATDLLDDLDMDRAHFVARELAAALPDEIAHALRRDRLEAISNLSLEATDRLLRSPAICQALRTHKAFQVAPAIEAEIVLDQRPDEKIDAWSALGDVWLGSVPPPEAASSLSRNAAGRLVGPKIFNRIPIDLSLNLIPEFPGTSLSAFEHVEATPMPAALDKLNQAMAVLSAACPEACAAVTRMTSNLVLRDTGSSTGKMRSATSAAALGRTVLVDIDQPSVSIAEIAEAVVHEAIHTLTSCAELKVPLIGSDANPVERVSSPWTGAELHPQAFVHACLVWFGLLNFWLAAEQQGSLRDHAGRRLSEIRAGFAKLDLADAQISKQVHMPQATLALLSDVQQRARQCG